MSKPKSFKFLSLLLLAIVMYFVINKRSSQKAGALATDFETELIDGTSFKLSDLRGSYVLLDFWGSWCPPCRKENPKLVSLYHEYKDSEFERADGFELVTIALEKNDKRYKSAAQKDGFIWPYQIMETSRYVLTAPLALKYGVSNVPAKFLIDPNGQIVAANKSFEEIKHILDQKLKA